MGCWCVEQRQVEGGQERHEVRRVWVRVSVRVRVRVRVVIKPLPLSRYPIARKGILFGGPAMEKRLDTRRR